MGWWEKMSSFLMGMRKWTIIVLLFIVAVVAKAMGWITGEQFVQMLSGPVMAFIGGNSVEHTTKAVIEWQKEKTKRGEQADLGSSKSSDTGQS